MPGVLKQIKSQVGQLNLRERAELAGFLLQSLEPEQDAAIAKAWRKEIASRVREIRAGKANGKPAEQVFAELREQRPRSA